MSLRGKRRERGGIISTLVALIFLALLCAGIYLARHPLLRFAADELIVEDPLEKSDAIIVLSDDNFYADRVTRAAELYRQGLAPVVVASGVRLRPYAGISELMTHDLVERGVPKEHILAFPQDADDTRDEALALKPQSPRRTGTASSWSLPTTTRGVLALSSGPFSLPRSG